MTIVLVMLNNYLHDLATGVLFGAAVAMWWLGREADKAGDRELTALRRAYPGLSRLALGALIWVLVGGIPRTIFFTRIELDPAIAPAAAAYIVPALVLKHVLMLTAVGLGLWTWRATRAKLAGPDA